MKTLGNDMQMVIDCLYIGNLNASLDKERL